MLLQPLPSAPFPFPSFPPVYAETSFISEWAMEIPTEGVVFAVAAAAAKIFYAKLAAPLGGLALGVLVTKLVLKIFDRYSNILLIKITKEICKFNTKHPYLQLIGFVFALSMALLSPPLGLVVGVAVGSFGAIVLDVEKYKRMQQMSRQLNKELASKTH